MRRKVRMTGVEGLLQGGIRYIHTQGIAVLQLLYTETTAAERLLPSERATWHNAGKGISIGNRSKKRAERRTNNGRGRDISRLLPRVDSHKRCCRG